MRSDEREKTGQLYQAMFRLYHIQLLFTHMNGDFSAIWGSDAASCQFLQWRVTYQIGVHTILHSFLCPHENCYRYSVNITSACQKGCSVLTTSLKGVSLFGCTVEGVFQFFYMKAYWVRPLLALGLLYNTLLSGPNSLEQTALSAKEEVTASILSPLGIERRSMT